MRALACWYCGKLSNIADAVTGMSVGNMVFSSISRVSTDYPPSSEQAEQETFVHMCEDCSLICNACLARLNAQLGPPDDEYVRSQDQNLEELMEENLSYDTDLRDFASKEHFIGCWFGLYPAVCVRREFRGMSLRDLLSAGFRFKGKVILGTEELEHFLGRNRFFGQPTALWGELLDHMQDRLGVREREQLKRLALVRPRIFDVSIWKLRSEGRF
jgi:hypothetical protein